MNDDFKEEDLDREAAVQLSGDRANRFYDRLRASVRGYVSGLGGAVEKTSEFLLLVPDVFILLWRLINDPRVNGKNKVLLGGGVAYYILPIDLLPEAFLGPLGYLDDLVFGVYVLNRMLTDTEPQILREHWSGTIDVLEMIQRVLAAADSLVNKQVLDRIRRMTK